LKLSDLDKIELFTHARSQVKALVSGSSPGVTQSCHRFADYDWQAKRLPYNIDALIPHRRQT
jgi:hypothetical protein